MDEYNMNYQSDPNGLNGQSAPQQTAGQPGAEAQPAAANPDAAMGRADDTAQNDNGYYHYSRSSLPGAGSVDTWGYGANGWQQQSPAARPPVMQAVPQKPKRRRGLGVVAMLLACALFGFGGGYAAWALLGGSGGTTVVYRAPETTLTGTSQGGYSVSEIAALAGQSVVSVLTETTVQSYFTGRQTVQGAGSGVILTEDGYIVTNQHVVDGASSITVILPDGSEHVATLVGADAASDIAVLKIDVTGLIPATVGSSDNLQKGEFCLAIGNALGTLDGTVTDGIISGPEREVNIGGSNMNLIQFSAAVSPGNSGGGLFNQRGELIGVVNAKSSGDDAENLGFAIPVNTAMEVVQQIIENGYVIGRPGLGVTVRAAADEQQAADAGLPGVGVYVDYVNPGSAAEQAGVQAGDRIVSADGQPVEVTADLSDVLAQKAIGDPLALVVERDGAQLELTVILQELASA